MGKNILKKQLLLFVSVLYCVNFNAQEKYFVAKEKNGGNTFSDIYKALDVISKKVLKEGYPSNGIEIIIKDGYYKIDKTIEIDKNLNGTFQNSLVIKAENPGKVHFFGGEILTLNEFKSFNAKKAGFNLTDKKAEAKIKVFDLKKAGIKRTELGSFFKHGYGFEKNPNFTTPAMLWVDGERMHLSRWPNLNENNEYYDNVNQFKGKFSDVNIKGAVSLLSIADKGKKKPNMWFKNKDYLENSGGTFTVAFDHAASWEFYKKNEEKIWLDGVLSASWEWEYTKVKRIEKRNITLATGANRSLGFFRKVTHFHFENVPEELDTQGEYFIDREKMLLYFYLPDDIKGKTITLSTLNGDMINIKGASNIRIEGLVLESGRGNGINIVNDARWKKVITQSNNIVVESCTIRNFNQWGILVQGPFNSKVNNCHIYNLGAGGVKLGKDVKSFKLEKENNVASNNKIHDIAFDQKSQVPGITLAGCGNIARNNEIYDTPHFAIKMKFANDCIAENNYMHDLPQYHHFDGGALYLATGGQFYNRGNQIRDNYFENIATNGAYLDNYTMGNSVFGNVFYNVGNSTKGSKNGAVYIHGGGQNIVENNIAIDCPYAYKTGSHIVKAPNTTNYLNLWYQDAELFKLGSPLYTKYVSHYPALKDFLHKLHNSPDVINKHVENKNIKAISSPKNKKSQINFYDLKGVEAHLNRDALTANWLNWFQLRYQSTTFKNNAYVFTSEKYVPNFNGVAKGVKGAFKLGGETGVFEMASYNLKQNGRTKKITNHVFQGNKWVKDSLDLFGQYSEDGKFIFNDSIAVASIKGFTHINFSRIGILKQ